MNGKKLPSKSQIRAQVDARVLQYLRSAPAARRVTDVARQMGIPVPAANVSLRRLLSGGDLVRSELPKFGSDGHIHGRVPIYKAHMSGPPKGGPAWFNPQPPKFAPGEITGRRVFRNGLADD